FFFQAEDGIRDFHVTGVQTCALPICVVPSFVPYLVTMPSIASRMTGFFSLKWKAFISIGLLLAVVFIGFIGFSSAYLRQQFEFSRERFAQDRKSTRLNPSHVIISYAV